MDAIDDVWRNRRDDLDTNAAALVEADRDLGRRSGPPTTSPGCDAVNGALKQIAGAFDAEWGGFGRRRSSRRRCTSSSCCGPTCRRARTPPRTVVTTSLDAMASGGMYDHIGGGFARYSVDREWLVPHFEKMLYDQALLVARLPPRRSRCSATTAYGCRSSTRRSSYVLRDLRHPDGGFYSAEDADSPDEHGHGHEGLFHTWTPDEVRRRCSAMADERRRRARVVRHHRGRQLRGTLDPQPARRTAASSPARPRSRRRGGGCSRPGRSAAARCSTTRCSPSGTRCSSPRWPRRRRCSGAPTGCRPRSPTASSCSASSGDPTAGGTGRWQADGTPPARHDALAADHAALVDAFTRLAEASGRGALDRRRPRDGRRDARPLLGRRPRRSVHDGRRRRAARRPPEGPLRQRHAVGQLDRRRSPCIRLAALTGELRYAQPCRPHPAAARHRDRARRRARSRTPLLGIETRSRGVTEVAIVGDRPDLVRLAQSLCRPDVVLAWGEPLRLTAVARTHRRVRLRVPRLRVRGAAGHAGGVLPPAHWARAPGRRSPTAEVDDLVRAAAGVRRSRPERSATWLVAPDGRARSPRTDRDRVGCGAVGAAAARP